MNESTLEQLSHYAPKIVESVVRSGQPQIIKVNGRPQVAVIALRARDKTAEADLDQFELVGVPAYNLVAIREAEADLLSGKLLTAR